MKPSRKQREIEARRAADPLAQILERTDIDYGSDDLPTAPRVVQKEIYPEPAPFTMSPYLAYMRGDGKPKPKVAPVRTRFEVWSEGWSATGNPSNPARLVGTVEAQTFREACYIAMCREYLDSIAERRKDNQYYNPDRFDYDFKNLTVWGCRLFNSQEEASKSFG